MTSAVLHVHRTATIQSLVSEYVRLIGRVMEQRDRRMASFHGDLLTSTGIGAALGHDDYHEAPKEDTDSHHLLRGESSNQPATGVLAKEITSVDHLNECFVREEISTDNQTSAYWQKDS